MSAAWKVGDIALVECSDGEWRRATAGLHPLFGPPTLVWRFPDRVYRPMSESNARPLLVLDPEDREQAKRFCQTWFGDGTAPIKRSIDDMQAALRSLIAPPKPDEPTGKFAVVVDADGHDWVKCANNRGARRWLRNGFFTREKWTAYADIAAVRVLSEGVEVDR